MNEFYDGDTICKLMTNMPTNEHVYEHYYDISYKIIQNLGSRNVTITSTIFEMYMNIYDNYEIYVDAEYAKYVVEEILKKYN